MNSVYQVCVPVAYKDLAVHIIYNEGGAVYELMCISKEDSNGTNIALHISTVLD